DNHAGGTVLPAIPGGDAVGRWVVGNRRKLVLQGHATAAGREHGLQVGAAARRTRAEDVLHGLERHVRLDPVEVGLIHGRIIDQRGQAALAGEEEVGPDAAADQQQHANPGRQADDETQVAARLRLDLPPLAPRRPVVVVLVLFVVIAWALPPATRAVLVV